MFGIVIVGGIGRLNSRQVRPAENKQTNPCAYVFAQRGEARKNI